MKETLKPGLTHRFKFKIPATKTVPHLYPEADAFQQNLIHEKSATRL